VSSLRIQPRYLRSEELLFFPKVHIVRDGDCVKVRIPHGSRYRMEQMQVVSP
jgi:hypothetical protein